MKHIFLSSDLCIEPDLKDAVSAFLESVGPRARVILADLEEKKSRIPQGLSGTFATLKTIRGMANIRGKMTALADQGVPPSDMLYLARNESDVRQLNPIPDQGAPLTFLFGSGDRHRILNLPHLLDLDPHYGLGRLFQAEPAEQYRRRIVNGYEGALQRLAQTRQAYIFGAQRLGRDLKGMLETMGVDVLGYLDNDPGKWGTEYAGRQVGSPRGVKDQDAVILIGTTRYIHDISRQLESMNFTAFISYPVLSVVDPALFPPEIPFVNVIEDLVHHRREYFETYIGLEDQKSRDVLNGLVEYRLTLRHEVIQDIFNPDAEQYFDSDILALSDHERFVDGGGYDGETTRSFIHYVKGMYDQIYYFEPDPVLMDKSRTLLADRKNIEYHTLGLYSYSGEIGFNQTGNTAGFISEGGNLKIRVCALDQQISDKITFIKMDVEGAEHDALLGAQNHIVRDKPALAVCAYHISQDLWRLQKLIRAWVPDYRFYLRHYSQTGLETVLFAVPAEP
jgi:FkbM family methyltransferase